MKYEPSPKTRQEFLDNINYSLAQLDAFDAGYTAATRNAVAYMKEKKRISTKEQLEEDFLWVQSVTENESPATD